MPLVKELLRTEDDGSVSFGNYALKEKAKLDNFKHGGDLLKVKTFADITRLERNELFVYESVPGTSVLNFTETANGAVFDVEGEKDAMITLGLEENTEYRVRLDGVESGTMKTNLGGKLNFSVELTAGTPVHVEIHR